MLPLTTTWPPPAQSMVPTCLRPFPLPLDIAPIPLGSGHYNLRMAIEVAKVELKSVQDASGLEERIREKQFAADEVVAVIGKTEGNGGGNDFTRILVDQAFR